MTKGGAESRNAGLSSEGLMSEVRRLSADFAVQGDNLRPAYDPRYAIILKYSLSHAAGMLSRGE